MVDRLRARQAWERLGIPEAGANRLIDEEGLESIEDLAILDLQQARDIVATLKKPGGGTT